MNTNRTTGRKAMEGVVAVALKVNACEHTFAHATVNEKVWMSGQVVYEIECDRCPLIATYQSEKGAEARITSDRLEEVTEPRRPRKPVEGWDRYCECRYPSWIGGDESGDWACGKCGLPHE